MAKKIAILLLFWVSSAVHVYANSHTAKGNQEKKKSANISHTEKIDWGIHVGLVPRVGPFVEYRYSDDFGVRTGLLVGVVFAGPQLAFGLHIPITLQYYPKLLRGLYILGGLEGSYCSGDRGACLEGPAISFIVGAGYSFADKWQVSLSPRYLYAFETKRGGYGGELSISYKFGQLF